MDPDNTQHPRWNALIDWLAAHGMDVSPEKFPVQARSSPDAGYGLFALRPIEPSIPLFSIPPKALLNSLTLAPHYPPAQPKLTCTQFVSLHLLLHRPKKGHTSSDPLFGPYISVLPEDFDSHPLTWLWKKERRKNDLLETRLVEVLPSRVLAKLDKMGNLFEIDWNTTKFYLRRNPTLTGSQFLDDLEDSYLWAWLNVNTRCVYHRLMKSRSDPDNMTLCPILDFANHAENPPYCIPLPTKSEIWNTGPLGKGKFGEKFVLLSPSPSTTSAGSEIYLRYGPHSNATLFSEYGFVLPHDTTGFGEDGYIGEFELLEPVEALFKERGVVGVWMKEILVAEGYWGDWTLYSTPAPAHPSYRLITALRLYHLIPLSTNAIPLNSEQLLDQWRNTTLGKQDKISEENETFWRGTLLALCWNVIQNGKAGIERVQKVDGGHPSSTTFLLASAKASIESLWREEVTIASAMIRSLENNEEF
ncbi:SET domain-containing protein [Pholiota conissans]|uniref:SET domain-containing protein n=1 Tax=Pholiota conissans TaxID=109636 RepID=A0A9P6CYD3_9AGAR|nr:SET domain-containing protein [Pholiota conissans]